MNITPIEFPGLRIDFAYGSVIGRDHLYCGKVLVGRNNQDAVNINQAMIDNGHATKYGD